MARKQALTRPKIKLWPVLMAIVFAVVGGLFIWRSLAATNPNLRSDLNNDNKVNVTDLSLLLSNYGKPVATGDINKDGKTDVTDLSMLLSDFGKTYTPGNPNPTPTTPTPPTPTPTTPTPNPGTVPPKTGGCRAPAGLKETDIDPVNGGSPIVAWRHKLGDAALIYYNVKAFPAEYAGYMKEAADLWNQSPCVDIKIVDSCPANSNCVTASLVKNFPDNDKVIGRYWHAARSGYMVSGTVQGATDLLASKTPAQRRLVIIHELGHSVSLRHRATQSNIMYWKLNDSMTGLADKTALDNIMAVYGVQSGATTNAMTAGTADTEGEVIITIDDEKDEFGPDHGFDFDYYGRQRQMDGHDGHKH